MKKERKRNIHNHQIIQWFLLNASPSTWKSPQTRNPIHGENSATVRTFEPSFFDQPSRLHSETGQLTMSIYFWCINPAGGVAFVRVYTSLLSTLSGGLSLLSFFCIYLFLTFHFVICWKLRGWVRL